MIFPVLAYVQDSPAFTGNIIFVGKLYYNNREGKKGKVK